MATTWNEALRAGVDRRMHFVLLMMLGSASSGDLIQPTFTPAASPLLLCRDEPLSRGFINGARAAVDPLGRGVWVVDDENDEVLLVGRPAPSTSAARVQRFRVGAWPEQVLPTPGGRTFVTARQAGVIGVIEPDGATWSIPLGTEPRAMALDLTTNRLFVGLVTALEVVSLDAESGAVLRRRALTAPPDFLALSPAGLVVASRRSDLLEVLDLDLAHRGSLSAGAMVAESRNGSSMRLADGRPPATSATALILGTGGLDFMPGAGELCVAGLGTFDDRLSLVLEEARPRTPAGASGYGGAGAPLQQLLVDGVLGPGGVVISGVTSVVSSPVADVLPLGRDTLLAFEGVAMAMKALGSPGDHRPTFLPRHEPVMLEGTPQALAVDDDGSLVVVSRSHRAVSWYRPARGLERAQTWTERVASVPLPESVLDPALRRGRELFFAMTPNVTGVGMTCATCHPDGRGDGRIWAQEHTLRQTPMLAERLQDTAPYNWLGTKRSLEANVTQTIRERLLGRGLGRSDRSALTRYLLEGLRPVQKRPSPAGTLVDEGRALFHDEEVGCAGCHDSERAFTDGKNHDVGSLLRREVAFAQEPAFGFLLSIGTGRRSKTKPPAAFNTPSLKHLALTPPYLHDGSAPTLSALIEDNHDRMGATSQLTPRERTALVAYLETL